MKKRIVTIGGANGHVALLKGLKPLDVDITAIVTVMDSGGSTGRLRKEHDIVAVGDIRRVFAALSSDETLLDQWNERTEEGHAVGNLVLRDALLAKGDMHAVLEELAEKHDVQATVLPVTTANVNLHAEYSDGAVVEGEGAMCDHEMPAGVRIQRTWLAPEAQATEQVLTALREADVIVLSMGDLYTSLLPNLLVQGVSDAIAESNATVVLVGNRVVRPNETAGFTSAELFDVVSRYIEPAVIDVFVVDDGTVPLPSEPDPIAYEPSSCAREVRADLGDEQEPHRLSGTKVVNIIRTQCDF